MALGFTMFRAGQAIRRAWGKVWMPVALGLTLLLTGCSLPQVSAESRLFLNLSTALVGSYTLPQTNFNGTTVGGFSALAYDAQQDRIYGLVDDKVNPRVYTLQLNREALSSSTSTINVKAVTSLQDPLKPEGAKPTATLDGEGMVLTRRGTFFIASEGNLNLKIPPRLSEFNRVNGSWNQDLTLPKQYWAFDPEGTFDLGVSPNRGFESLAINAEGDRLFTATQGPLGQDKTHPYSRFLHYWIGEPEPILISEHLYPLEALDAALDAAPSDDRYQGLRDLVSIDNAGHFLALEQSHSKTIGDRTVLYQLATGVATDISGMRTLPPALKGIVPILKKPLLDLADLNLPLHNFQGLTLGPQLADGSRSLLLISDNGMNSGVPTQVVMLKLGSGRSAN
jgi:hypothetical protein